MKRSVRLRLEDILNAIDEASEILDGRDLGEYMQSRATKRAVERCLEIVSEAARFVPDSLTKEFPGTGWPEIRAIGNVLRHSYQRVEDEVIWRTATRSLAELRPVIVELLARCD